MTTTSQAKPANAAKADQSARSSSKAPTPRPGTMISKVIALLERKGGATLEELTMATGWQSHSVRAALTGLKKKGHTIERTAVDGVSRYAIEAAS